MAAEPVADAALSPLAPGGLVHIGNREVEVLLAPAAGGRLAQLSCDGVDWLCSHGDHPEAIAWGSYPMVPWAGRIRHGRFRFDGRDFQLPVNLGAHAIHGVGFMLPWSVDMQSAAQVELSLRLPRDGSWPFGGVARQRLSVMGRSLRMELSVTAGPVPMPKPVLGWHPWFRKPDRLEFMPESVYPRDAEGLATLPTAPPMPGPWDDCFINRLPVTLHRDGQALRLTSSCRHWVVFDQRAHATCVEPQDAPPDAFNLFPEQRLEAGEMTSAWLLLEWAAQS